VIFRYPIDDIYILFKIKMKLDTVLTRDLWSFKIQYDFRVSEAYQASVLHVMVFNMCLIPTWHSLWSVHTS